MERWQVDKKCQHRAGLPPEILDLPPFWTKVFQKCQILRNFVQNFPFLPLFWLFLTQIKAFLPQGKKYRPTEMVGLPTNGRYTNLSGSPDTESQVKFFSWHLNLLAIPAMNEKPAVVCSGGLEYIMICNTRVTV